MNKSLKTKKGFGGKNKTNKNSNFGRSEYMTSVIFGGNDDDVGKIIKVRIDKSNSHFFIW